MSVFLELTLYSLAYIKRKLVSNVSENPGGMWQVEWMLGEDEGILCLLEDIRQVLSLIWDPAFSHIKWR